MRAIIDHLDHRRDELHRYSSGLVTHAHVDQMLSLAADGAGGIVDGAIPLDDDAVMYVNEILELGDDGRVRIRRYSYFLIVDDNEICGYCLKPTGESHFHVGPHNLIEACEPVTLRAAYEVFWDRYNEVRAQPSMTPEVEGA